MVGRTTAGQAETLAALSDYDISAATDNIDVTAGGDKNKQYAAGLPDFSGSLTLFYNDQDTATTDPLWAAARDGAVRRFYLYPNFNAPTFYFYGFGLFDWSQSAGVGAAVVVKTSITAGGDIGRMPA
ncbi:MAG: hypothetical protein WKF86_00150 [Acidimicrobiales bacterium]